MIMTGIFKILVFKYILINQIKSWSINIHTLYKNTESQCIVRTSRTFLSLLLVYNLLLFSLLSNEQLAFAHSFFGGNDANFNGTQTQSVKNYTVDL